MFFISIFKDGNMSGDFLFPKKDFIDPPHQSPHSKMEYSNSRVSAYIAYH